MGSRTIRIDMGEGIVASGPHIVASAGIGSCVVITLYDTKRKVGAMAHVMLPDSDVLLEPAGCFQCADTAVHALLEGLRGRGSFLQDLVAKMVGGARMFSSYDHRSTDIGTQNIRKIKHILREVQIPLAGWDLAGRYGRSVEFHLITGKLVVQAAGGTDKVF